MLQTRAIGATPSTHNQTQLKCYATACSLQLCTQHKAKASVGFSITASAIVTFKGSLSRTQRNETKYQLEGEGGFVTGVFWLAYVRKCATQTLRSTERWLFIDYTLPNKYLMHAFKYPESSLQRPNIAHISEGFSWGGVALQHFKRDIDYPLLGTIWPAYAPVR